MSKFEQPVHSANEPWDFQDPTDYYGQSAEYPVPQEEPQSAFDYGRDLTQAARKAESGRDDRLQQYGKEYANDSASALRRADQVPEAKDSVDAIFDYHKPAPLGRAYEVDVPLVVKPQSAFDYGRDLTWEANKKAVSRQAEPRREATPEEVLKPKQRAAIFVNLLERRLDGEGVNAEYDSTKAKLFTDLGFKPHEYAEVSRAWASYGNAENKKRPDFKEQYVRIIRQNLDRLTYIDSLQPGAGAELYRTYGIRNFGRYEPGHLLQQHEGKRAVGSGNVLLAAADDWNGAFSNNMHLSLSAKEANMEGSVIVEAASPIEAFRRLMNVKQNFGKIRQIYVSAHGSENLIQFRGENKLEAEQLEKSQALQRLIDNGTLEPDTDIMLSACYASGLARAVSKQTTGRVVAPGAESYGVYVDDRNGKIRHSANKKVEMYEQGRRVDGVGRIRTLGRKALKRAGFSLAA